MTRFLADDCMGLGQQVAYSAVLAFFPAVAFLLGLLGVLNLYDQMQSFLASVAPQGVISFIEGLQKDSAGSASITALLVGGVGAIWAASGAMGSVIKAVNRAYNRWRRGRSGRCAARRSCSCSSSASRSIVLSVLIVFGGPIGHAIANKAGLGHAFDVLWNIAALADRVRRRAHPLRDRLLLRAERGQRRWQWVTPGSFVGALLWLVLSGLFTLYVSFAGSYSKTYGSLAAGVILLLWLNYSAWAVLFGAELNAELDRAGGHPRRRRRARRADQACSARALTAEEGQVVTSATWF